jgi:hypothetical protein
LTFEETAKNRLKATVGEFPPVPLARFAEIDKVFAVSEADPIIEERQSAAVEDHVDATGTADWRRSKKEVAPPPITALVTKSADVTASSGSRGLADNAISTEERQSADAVKAQIAVRLTADLTLSKTASCLLTPIYPLSIPITGPAPTVGKCPRNTPESVLIFGYNK